MQASLLPSLILPVLLVLTGCQQGPAVREDTPSLPPAWQQATPGWLPLHAKPRLGDYAVHQRLDARGLTPMRRRSEVIGVGREQVEIRQTFNQPDSPAMHFILDRQGEVRSAWVVPAGTTERQQRPVLRAVHRSRKAIRDKAPLPLVSGSFPVSEIVSRTIILDNGRQTRQVDYLSNAVPFRTLVSLSGKRSISHRQAVRLINRIAVPESANKRPLSDAPITEGWVMMRWGHATERRR